MRFVVVRELFECMEKKVDTFTFLKFIFQMHKLDILIERWKERCTFRNQQFNSQGEDRRLDKACIGYSLKTHIKQAMFIFVVVTANSVSNCCESQLQKHQVTGATWT